MNAPIVPRHSKSTHKAHEVDHRLLQAYTLILDYLQRDNDLTDSELANYHDTSIRAAKAFESLTSTAIHISNELLGILGTGFPKENDNAVPGLITQGPITMYGLCPHHLLQVTYTCYVSYIPVAQGPILGLSKLARICKVLAKRPVLQEQLANDIADTLHYKDSNRFPSIRTKGSAVTLTGKHSCMASRGVQEDALTSVTELRGCYWETDLEQKFYQAVQAINYNRGSGR